VYRVGGREYHSLEEMPPEVRRMVEEGMRGGRAPMPRAGCVTWLIALVGKMWR